MNTRKNTLLIRLLCCFLLTIDGFLFGYGIRSESVGVMFIAFTLAVAAFGVQCMPARSKWEVAS